MSIGYLIWRWRCKRAYRRNMRLWTASRAAVEPPEEQP